MLLLLNWSNSRKFQDSWYKYKHRCRIKISLWIVLSLNGEVNTFRVRKEHQKFIKVFLHFYTSRKVKDDVALKFLLNIHLHVLNKSGRKIKTQRSKQIERKNEVTECIHCNRIVLWFCGKMYTVHSYTLHIQFEILSRLNISTIK